MIATEAWRLAVGSGGPVAVVPAGESQRVEATLPGTVIFLDREPETVQLPLDLSRRPWQMLLALAAAATPLLAQAPARLVVFEEFGSGAAALHLRDEVERAKSTVERLRGKALDGLIDEELRYQDGVRLGPDELARPAQPGLRVKHLVAKNVFEHRRDVGLAGRPAAPDRRAITRSPGWDRPRP